MLSFVTKARKNRKGFTLIELIVVITIIGILAGSASLVIGTNSTTAEEARMKADIRTMVSALELYKASGNAYPAEASAVSIYDEASALKTITPNYLKKIPSTITGWTVTYISPGPAPANLPYIISATKGATTIDTTNL